MKVPYNTLYMLQSLDGKISTGIGDRRDLEHDDLGIQIVDYYKEMSDTDYWCLITDVILHKMCILDGRYPTDYHKHGFILWYNGHCSIDEIDYLTSMCEKLIVVNGDSVNLEHDGREILKVKHHYNVREVMSRLYSEFGVDRICVMSGGRLNAALVRAGLIHEVILYVMPVLIGGADTPSLISGSSFVTADDVTRAMRLELVSVTTCSDSCLRLHYMCKEVINT